MTLLAPLQLATPGGAVRGALARLRLYTRLHTPPQAHADRVLYGFAQPILGARALFADAQLMREALLPAGALGLACALFAGLQGGGHWFAHFYKAFAALAPLPSFVFANHYARLAALLRRRLDFGACGPREMPVPMLAGRIIRQALIVAVGILPFAGLSQLLPGVGPLLSSAMVALWGLHWVVADAFDDAQVCEPGESLAASIQRDRDAPPPWFVRLLLAVARPLPGVLAGPIRWFARLCDKLALDSRGELAIMEGHPFISLGFALGAVGLLATPVLNLLFRPIILAGAAHLLAQLENRGHHT